MDTSRELSRTLFTTQEEVLHLLRLSSEILTSSSRDMNTSLLLKECTQANSSIGELSETMKTTKTSVATNFILTLMLIIVFSFTFNYFKDIYTFLVLKEDSILLESEWIQQEVIEIFTKWVHILELISSTFWHFEIWKYLK